MVRKTPGLMESSLTLHRRNHMFNHEMMRFLKSRFPQKRSFTRAMPMIWAYGNVLYYIEIIYFMIALGFLYGKVVALTAGLSAVVLLTIHIIRFYSREARSRIIQLAVMELHGAYAAVFIIGLCGRGGVWTPLDFLFIVNRGILAVLDIGGLYFLTDEQMKHEFSGGAASRA